MSAYEEGVGSFGMTQEEVDREYVARERARKKALAEQAEVNNAKLSFPKDYRGIRYMMNQYGSYVIPDAPKELDGMFTAPSVVHTAIDRYLDHGCER